MKSPRCLHFSSPGIRATIHALMVQCWLGTSHKRSVPLGVSFAELGLQRVLRASLEGWCPLSSKQLNLTAIASIPLPVSLSGPANIYLCKAEMLAQEKARATSIGHLHPAVQGDRLEANSPFKTGPK